MRIRIICCLLLAGPPGIACAADTALPRVDLPALIQCQAGVEDFHALAPILEDPLKAVALGWRPLPQANLFMTEYVLTTPIEVFGHPSDRIAFSGSGIVAVLDLPDPRPLARQLELETGVDTPSKVMFGREVRSDDVVDAATGTTLIESVILSVSNVTSHPGKTLAGCSYSLDRPGDENAPDEPDPEDAPASPVRAGGAD